MSARVEFSFDQHVELPAGDAYALLCDFADHARWVPMTEVSVHEDGSFTAYTGIKPVRLVDRMRVTYRNDETMTVRIAKTGPVLTGDAGFSVRPFTEETCIVSWEEDVQVPIVPRVLAPLLAGAARAAFRRALRNLPPRQKAE